MIDEIRKMNSCFCPVLLVANEENNLLVFAIGTPKILSLTIARGESYSRFNNIDYVRVKRGSAASCSMSQQYPPV